MDSPQRVHVGGTPVDLCGVDDLVELTTRWGVAGRRSTVVGVNAHVVNLCAADRAFAAAVAAADLNFPDGQSVVWAARLLGHRPRGRVPLTHVTAPMCGAWAAARLPVARATNLNRTLKDWAQRGLQVIGLDAEGDTVVDELDGSGPLVVVVGSEGKGLSRLVRATCDAVVSIPMAGATESLNASVAAGVVLAEIARQRR